MDPVGVDTWGAWLVLIYHKEKQGKVDFMTIRVSQSIFCFLLFCRWELYFRTNMMVDRVGFEPTTSAMPMPYPTGLDDRPCDNISTVLFGY
jgi:hypothetical protein